MTSSVFQRIQKNKVVGPTIGQCIGRTGTEGDVGIEIEVEGVRLPQSNLPIFWKYCPDGSLRGEENGEYVLREPVIFDAVPTVLERLWETFRERDSVLDDSNRTSVHIHFNIQNFHINRLTSLLAMYYTLEEVLTEWCGEHRVGNLFCLRAKDAGSIVNQAIDFVKSGGAMFPRETMHYAAVSLSAIRKFGSLEFRTLAGVSDPKVIETWVNILRRLYDLSAEYSDPRKVCELFSMGGPKPFFDTILGEFAEVVREGIPMTESDIRDSMFEGIRIAQDLCYCYDWDLFVPTPLPEQPQEGLLPLSQYLLMKEAKLQETTDLNIPFMELDFEEDFDDDDETDF